jgi:hypothetical protein
VGSPSPSSDFQTVLIILLTMLLLTLICIFSLCHAKIRKSLAELKLQYEKVDSIRQQYESLGEVS